MKSKYEVKLKTDSNGNVLVDSHQGKLMFDGTSKPLKGQAGVACTIASRERLRTFFGKEAEKHNDLKTSNGRQAELLLKPIKKILSAPPIDFQSLFTNSISAIEKLSFDPLTEIFKNPSFIKLKTKYNLTHPPISSTQFYNTLSNEIKGSVAFFTLIDKLDSQFGFENLNWKIQDGFEGLQASLRQNGQIIFQGKYGACFHRPESIKYHVSESTPSREVYFFARGSLQPSTWTHCVIVDQAKLIDGKPYVFFRDPYNASIQGKPDKVYMLSYGSFIERISDKYGNTGEPDYTYGIARKPDVS